MKNGDRVFDGCFGRHTLNGLKYNAFSFFVGVDFGLVHDVIHITHGFGFGFSFHRFNKHLFGFLARHARNGLQLFHLLTVKALNFLVFMLNHFQLSREGFFGHLRHLFLPAVSTAVWLVPLLLRNLRATLIQEMEADYVVAGRSKGLPESVNFLRHVLMNSLIPTLNLLGVMLAYLIGGAVVVEIVYAVPGIGTLMVNSVLGRDFYVIQGLTIVYALLTVSITLVVDVLSSLIDPRIKL